MPYESFPYTHHVTIRGLVQDATTGSWRFLLHVKRSMQGDAHSRPQVYAIRRSYADFKRLYAAICPAVAVLPKLPVDSLFSFFVGETQTVLQKKRVVLEAILKAIESHPRASECAAFLEFAANSDSYEQFSDAPPSPVESFKDFSASYEFHKATHTQRLGAPGGEMARRRNSTLLPLRSSATDVLSLETRTAGETRPRRHTIEADMENCVEFARYSNV